MKNINIILFNDFTALDAFGPAEVFARLGSDCEINYYSLTGGIVTSSTRNQIMTQSLDQLKKSDILLVPGGWGTRSLVSNNDFIAGLCTAAENSEYVLCVCTGSVLLAKTGLLDGRCATSNKVSWDWVVSQSSKVQWKKRARWVCDGKYYTSSGITAGIDMALGFVRDTISLDKAGEIANGLEYLWNKDKDFDPFAD